ncbi:ABC transporter permease [Clostridium peptidivorans]|uniref:ABC transporter permease n=1 Tax=Clostridium peptidivorans TaxID=100174 RepID=UPI000BE2708C|nr:FtsX-like permease family protein [Clostridium peptidivorans]
MKFENNNKAIINKLTRKSIKGNKLRNIFAIIAIALTTILFTALFTIGMGMVESMEQQSMRQAGGYAHGTFKKLTREELNNIKDNPLIKELGYSIMVSMGENKEFIKHHTEVRYATDTQAKMWFSYPTKGEMPEKENEVATSTAVLDLLEVPHETGKRITIEYYIGKEKLSTEFVLSGFWESDEVGPGSMVLVSNEFIDKNLKNVNIDKDDETGLIYADVLFRNSLNIEENMDAVLKSSGYSSDRNSPNFIATGVNWAYMSTNFGMDVSTIIAILAATLLIIFTGYLIIYNIFQISVIRDVRFYGLLKTIGMTPKQIKRLIRKQALMLSIAGIPIGLVAGYGIGNILLPTIMSTSSFKVSYTSFSPVIFIGATIFSLITVFISCRKPGKIASRVSPVEATKYIDVADKGKTHKNSFNGGKVHNMALFNILRNKGKTAVVIISISLSLILLNSVFTLTNGFDMNKFLERYVITDFMAGNANYFNVIKSFESEDDVISEEMINKISRLEGIENSGRIYYNVKETRTRIGDKETTAQLYGLDDFPLSQLNIFEGEFDLEKFKTGNYIIEGVKSDDNGKIKYETSKFNIGDKVTVALGNNITKEYEVMAKAEDKYNMSVRYSFGGSNCIMYLPSKKFIGEIKNPLTMTYVFNVEDKYIEQTERFLQDYTKKIEPQMDYESKQKFIDEFKGLQNTFLLVGGTLSFIIGIIGILNFINAMLTSIISRRREFAMLQSIGMTNKQLNKMLILEGGGYALATIVLSVILGSLVSLIVIKPIASSLWFYNYKFIISPILITAPILILISVFVPFISYISVNKQSIVERLREVE